MSRQLFCGQREEVFLNIRNVLRSRNILESGLGLRSHVGADLDEADVGGAARAAFLGLARKQSHTTSAFLLHFLTLPILQNFRLLLRYQLRRSYVKVPLWTPPAQLRQ